MRNTRVILVSEGMFKRRINTSYCAQNKQKKKQRKNQMVAGAQAAAQVSPTKPSEDHPMQSPQQGIPVSADSIDVDMGSVFDSTGNAATVARSPLVQPVLSTTYSNTVYWHVHLVFLLSPTCVLPLTPVYDSSRAAPLLSKSQPKLDPMCPSHRDISSDMMKLSLHGSDTSIDASANNRDRTISTATIRIENECVGISLRNVYEGTSIRTMVDYVMNNADVSYYGVRNHLRFLRSAVRNLQPCTTKVTEVASATASTITNQPTMTTPQLNLILNLNLLH